MANEPNEEEQPLLHAATYTQAPKVSHKVLTKEERQTLIKGARGAAAGSRET